MLTINDLRRLYRIVYLELLQQEQSHKYTTFADKNLLEKLKEEINQKGDNNDIEL